MLIIDFNFEITGLTQFNNSDKLLFDGILHAN